MYYYPLYVISSQREKERGRKTDKERADERHEEKERLIADGKEIVREKVRKRAEREREREREK